MPANNFEQVTLSLYPLYTRHIAKGLRMNKLMEKGEKKVMQYNVRTYSITFTSFYVLLFCT